MPRLAPGSDNTTLKAINLVEFDHNDELAILDIACGVGTQTVLLANFFENATIEAIDLFRHYINEVEEKIALNNLSNRVHVYRMDMNDLDFANEEFDILFCEASIHIMGFKKALKEWKRLLKVNGYLVASDISWISAPSVESRKFWKNNYEEVDSIKNKIKIIEKEGYEFIDYAVVPKEDWKNYFSALEKNLAKISSDGSAKVFINELKKEISVYMKNSDDYSYVFYVMRKADHQ